jgi:DNA modification methylase
MLETGRVHIGDARALAAALAPGSVQAVITSPPYWGLRRYLPAGHPDAAREMGSEESPEEYVAGLVALFAAIRPALRDDGTLWLNLGDAYANDAKWGGATGGKHAGGLHGESGIGRAKRATGYPPKCLMGLPWRVAFALIDDGWVLRSDVIWHKPNPMPESVRDRPTRSHEYLFLLSKSARYFYDAEAIAEPIAEASAGRYAYAFGGAKAEVLSVTDNRRVPIGTRETPTTRNKRDVWTIPTTPYPDAHFATFSPELVRPCVRAGTPEHGCCAACGAPWRRVVEREQGERNTFAGGNGQQEHRPGVSHDLYALPARTVGWSPSCACGTSERRPAVVLDCFAGSGTTAQVCVEEGRDWVGFDLDERSVGWHAGRLRSLPVRSLFAPASVAD